MTNLFENVTKVEEILKTTVSGAIRDWWMIIVSYRENTAAD